MKNNCVWLGLAAMIYSFDKEESHKMVQAFDNEDNYKYFNWMYIMRLSNAAKRQKTDDSVPNILVERLKERKIWYYVKKIPASTFQPRSDGYKSYILDEDNTGRFIVGLEGNGGSLSHCVSIDCRAKKIYDSMEKYILPLNEKNLDHCVGTDQVGVHRISHCYEILKKDVKDPSKKKKKNRSETKRNLKRKAEDIEK